MKWTSPSLVLAASALLASEVHAGSFSQNFNGFADGTTDLSGSAVCSSNTTTTPAGGSGQPTCCINGGALRLISMLTNDTSAAFKLADLDPGSEITEFTATFKVRMNYQRTPAVVLPAEGWSFNFGPLPNNFGNGELGFAMSSGLSIGWDTGNGGDPTSIEIFSGGVSIGNFVRTFAFDESYRNVTIHWERSSGLDVTWGTVTICADYATPNFLPSAGYLFGFSARTGSIQRQDVTIEDLNITTSFAAPISTSGPIISELLASNESGPQDEDCDRSDWIELYNGTASPVDMGGWFLTDRAEQLTKWQIPAGVTLAPYTYFWLWASGKDRPLASRLHANFSLSKAEGSGQTGYVALVQPNGTIASAITYEAQVADYSYGIRTSASDYSYLTTPTPGSKNIGDAALAAPAEEVVASRGSGIITDNISLSFNQPAAPGAVLRFTTNNTPPTATSSIYTAPLTISVSTVVQARVFLAGHLPGPLKMLNFVRIATDLQSYQGSGLPFSSNLPIVVIDSFLNNIDATSSSSAPRPYRYCYATIFDTVLAGRAKILVAPLAVPPLEPHYQGVSGLHVRGSSSSSFPQLSYSWETWNAEMEDKEESLLGMPEDSDWILYAPYNDKTLMRNVLAYNTMNALRGSSAAVRTRFVELFFNQNDSAVSYADYRGVYVLMEKIKRGRERVNIEPLKECMNTEPLISGGYIFRKDRISGTDVTISTTTTQPWGAQTLPIVEPEQATTAQKTWLQNYMQQFENSLTAANWTDPLVGYRQYIDTPSFCDNHLWVEAFKQIDGFRLSAYYSKDRAGKVTALPVWDYNLSLGNGYYQTGDQPQGWYYQTIPTTISNAAYPYYPRLLQDPEFLMEYWDRYWQLRRGPLAPGALEAKIDTYSAQLNEAQSRHFARWAILAAYQWPNPNGWELRSTFEKEVAWMKEWIRQRLDWMDYSSLSPQALAILPPEIRSQNDKAPIYDGNVPPNFQLTLNDPNRTPAGEILYTIDGPDPRQLGGSADPAAQAFAVSPAAPLTLVNSGATWRYQAGVSTAPPASWKSTAFDDAAWPSGSAKFGYGDSQATTVPSGSLIVSITTGPDGSIPPPAYFRTTFTVADPSAVHALWLELNVDDGAVIYLNGQEAVRFNMPYPPAVIDHTTQATNGLDSLSAYETTYHPLKLQPSLLVSGVNHLAVEVHQVLYDSRNASIGTQPDMAFDLRLMAHSFTWGNSPLTLATPGSHIIRSRLKQGSQWSPLAEAAFVVGAVPATPGTLVVSELHYHPADPRTDEIPLGFNNGNDFEFIELMNISDQALDLTGVTLSGAVAFDFSNGSPAARYLLPGQRVLVVENDSAFLHRHPTVPASLIAGTFTGNLSNSGERLVLADSTSAAIQDFTYNDKEPWPTAADGPQPPQPATGQDFSLVLNNPSTNPDHKVGTNWRASALSGGNPGASDGTAPPPLPTGDDDNDGVPNMVEHALGDAPLELPTLEDWTPDAPGAITEPYLMLRIPRRSDADGFLLAPETSTELATWQQDTLTYLKTDYTTSPPQQIWRSVQPASTLPSRLYARIRILPP